MPPLEADPRLLGLPAPAPKERPARIIPQPATSIEQKGSPAQPAAISPTKPAAQAQPSSTAKAIPPTGKQPAQPLTEGPKPAEVSQSAKAKLLDTSAPKAPEISKPSERTSEPSQVAAPAPQEPKPVRIESEKKELAAEPEVTPKSPKVVSSPIKAHPELLEKKTPVQKAAEAPASPVELSAVPAEPAPALGTDTAFFPIASPDPNAVSINAERIQGRSDSSVEASGNVELHRGYQAIYADKLVYDAQKDEALASGQVRIEQGGNRIEGTELQANLGTQHGHLDKATFQLEGRGGRGSAEKIQLKGPNRLKIYDGRYTTCEPGNDDWYLNVKELDLNRSTQIGTARHASVEFKGVPFLYAPRLSFALNNQRKSGLLSPSFGTTNTSGTEITVPFYWNIAPNYDATIAPRNLSRRGLQWQTEFRYLNPGYDGEVNFDWLPDDEKTNEKRYELALFHEQTFGRGWNGYVNYHRVSDDDYYTDFSTHVTSTSRVNLPREGAVFYSNNWLNFTTRMQSYQTLQDPKAPVTPPYDRLPQVLLNINKQNVLGADAALNSEYVHFDHSNLVSGKRLIAYPSVTLPLSIGSYGFVKPKVGVRYAGYSLNRDTNDNPTVTVPIASLDSGLILERNAAIGNQNYRQTLEPRLYYLYVPFRDQNDIPNFDTAEADFNFTQLFSENRFTGGDRIGDASTLTAAITTRLLKPGSGQEFLRATIGQRFNFQNQDVVLASPVNTRSGSDFLASIGAQVFPGWSLDSGWQFNPHEEQTEKFSVGVRYHPQPGKALNFSHRYIRDDMEQFDLSGQWPLSSKWSALGRWNYSTHDSKTLETLAGLEYDGGCWAARLVYHQLVTLTNETQDAFFVQLELNGLAGIGSNPLDVLKRNIPGYTKINENP